MKKIYTTRITGKCVFRGCGGSKINSEYCSYIESDFDEVLDEDLPNATIQILDNGLLAIYLEDGDEMPHSDLYLLKDWKTELEEKNIDVLETAAKKTQFQYWFGSSYGRNNGRIPNKVNDLIK